MNRGIALACLIAAASGCASGRPRLSWSWIVGKPLDLGVSNLEGAPVAVGGPDGTVRVVVLWATWCRSCWELFPALDVLSTAGEGRRLSICAVSVDEDAAQVRAVEGRVPSRVRVLWDRGAERLGERLGVERLPTLVILDRRGIVRYVHEGTDAQLLPQVDREVGRLLSE